MSIGPKELKRAADRLRRDAEADATVQGKLATASAEFEDRYLRWCLKESEAECDRGFQLVSTVRDLTVPVFLEYIKPLGRPDQLDLVIALCKKLHQPHRLSQREQQICQHYDEFFTVPFRHPSGVLLPSSRVPAFQLERQEEYLRRKPDRRSFQQDIRAALKSVADSRFGSIKADHPTLLSYQKQIDKWYLVTSFEMGRREQLRYLHCFHALPDGSPATKLPNGISLLNWTGIFSDTSWSYLLPEEIATTVESVRTICLYFLERAGDLVSGLANPLPGPH
jgi:hypothetical protein